MGIRVAGQTSVVELSRVIVNKYASKLAIAQVHQVGYL